ATRLTVSATVEDQAGNTFIDEMTFDLSDGTLIDDSSGSNSVSWGNLGSTLLILSCFTLLSRRKGHH
ncbi:MAG TPA: hypothetical protein VJ044_03120, partial [Candidatus Hodarchaeales archaeon]|nr:hypothetical protein [Candidatus Hodarchaeales archaeon]